MKITVDSSQFDTAYALVRQWRRRSLAIRKQFLYLAVRKTYQDVIGYLPSDRKELRSSFTMQRVTGLPDTADGYVICSIPKAKAIVENESDAVIYVAPKRGLMRRVPKATLLLEEYSPWTLETLPYPPDPKTADVISRRVSPREVVRVRRARLRDRPEWRRRMIKEGIKLVNPGRRTKSQMAAPDTAFESLRLEFGLGGEPSKPHWRKAILKLALRGGAGMIARKREFTQAMTSLSFNTWKRWPPRVSAMISVSRAKRYVPFQQRLGLRIGDQ